MKYYFQAFRDYADLNGRIDRKEFWVFTLINVLICFILQVFGVKIGFPILGSLYLFISVIPFASASARRLIDAGKSKLWLFFALFFPIGTLVVIYFLCLKSAEVKNIKKN